MVRAARGEKKRGAHSDLFATEASYANQHFKGTSITEPVILSLSKN